MRSRDDRGRASRRRLVLGAAVLALALLSFVAHVVLWRPAALAGATAADGYTRAAAVVHVHSTVSDGGGTPEEVIAAAQAAGVDLLVLTDHNVVEPKAVEGYHGRTLVLVGTEISTSAGHLLGLGVRAPSFRFSGDLHDALDDVRHLGGQAVAAHPTSPLPSFRWEGWDAPGPWGLELLNGDSQWREAGWLRLLRTGLLYGLNRRYALLGSLSAPDAALARWDALLAQRDVVGLAGADAHSRVALGKRRAVRFPSYEALFGLARNYLLLAAPLSGDAGRDGPMVRDALARGRLFVGVEALAPAAGFSFVAESGARRWTMGETVPPEPPPVLRAGGALPAGARLRLLRDGRTLAEAETRLEAAATRPGVYRVEVRLPGRPVPWVLANPIFVFDAVAAAARARRGAWPDEPPPPQAAAVLDDFEGRSAFHVEVDPSSAAGEVLAPGAGPDGSGAGRLAFRLGAPGPGRPYTWCALVNREARDLTGRRGLVFWLRGDGVYRLWVQVRDANPASADDGTEWWFASVRTAPEWRRVAVPFARLRSLDKNSDGRLDPGRVRVVAFVLDGGAVPVGSAGTIWVDQLGVY